MKVHELIALLEPYAELEVRISWDEQVTGDIETQEEPINAIFSNEACITLSADGYQHGTAIWKLPPPPLLPKSYITKR